MSCVTGRPWNVDDLRRLREIVRRHPRDRRARMAALVQAFPDRTPASLAMTVKRVASRPQMEQPPIAIDRDVVRERFYALPGDVIFDGIARLLERGPLFGRAAATALVLE